MLSLLKTRYCSDAHPSSLLDVATSLGERMYVCSLFVTLMLCAHSCNIAVFVSESSSSEIATPSGSDDLLLENRHGVCRMKYCDIKRRKVWWDGGLVIEIGVWVDGIE